MNRLFLKLFAWFVAANLLAVLVTVLLVRPLWQVVGPDAEQARNWGIEAIALYESDGRKALNHHLLQIKSDHDMIALLLTPQGRPASLAHVPPPFRHMLRRHIDRHIDGAGHHSRRHPPLHRMSLSGERGDYTWVLLAPRSLDRWHGIGVLRFVVSAIVLALFAFAVAWWISRPIRALGSSVEQLSIGHLDARVPARLVERRDEIGTLAAKINAMAERLDAQVESRTRLLRDVSHELRSPLARLEVALALARERDGGDSPELARIELETRRLEALIDEVMILSRLDDPDTDMPREAVDLTDLVGEVIGDAEFLGGPEIRLEMPAAPVVSGNRSLLRSAIENVVRNAARYSPVGAAIDVSVDCTDDWVTIRVRDRGPGVGEAELGEIFRPFYRTSTARDRDSGGHGVGLAIVDRVTRSHGGTAIARIADGGGLEVELRLPAMIDGASGSRS